jgi:hypothetical protein
MELKERIKTFLWEWKLNNRKKKVNFGIISCELFTYGNYVIRFSFFLCTENCGFTCVFSTGFFPPRQERTRIMYTWKYRNRRRIRCFVTVRRRHYTEYPRWERYVIYPQCYVLTRWGKNRGRRKKHSFQCEKEKTVWNCILFLLINWTLIKVPQPFKTIGTFIFIIFKLKIAGFSEFIPPRQET